MIPVTPSPRCLLSHLHSATLLPIGLAALGMLGQASAVSVDSELVLLVDISKNALKKKEFSPLMASYADAMTSQSILNSIQSGAFGKIAVSLMFYGDSSVQQIGIPWMEIGNASDAAQFAALVGSLAQPSSGKDASISNGIAAATISFGTETGGASNGFESTAQIIDVAAASVPSNSAAASANATSTALSSGVDIINAIALGKKTTAIENYFSANVIGSTADGVVASVSSSDFDGALTSNLISALNGSILTATAVPEPSSAAGAILGAALLLIRRRRS